MSERNRKEAGTEGCSVTDLLPEMVERVALAIWQRRERHFPGRVQRLNPDEIDRASGAWLLCVDLAGAAISAMRSPTEPMVRAAHASTAGWLGLPGPQSGLSQALFKHERRYTAMIDAALREGQDAPRSPSLGVPVRA